MIDKIVTRKDLMRGYNLLKELSKTNSHVETGRLDRALGLVMRKEKYDKYATTWTGCTCADDQNRGRIFVCKHRLAYMMEHTDDLLLVIFEGTPIN